MNWTSIDKEKPPQGEIVWVYDPSAVFETGKQRLVKVYLQDKIWNGEFITHWKPKPQNP